ncbi:MAG TPA: PLDc N-terminal domain-containing protein, partial [Pirellulales bacterium]
MFIHIDSPGWWTTSLLVADWVIRLGLSVRVIMRGRPVGFTLAWLAVVLSVPLVGAGAYLMFGELRLGRRRADYAARIHGPYRQWLADLHNRAAVDWRSLGEEAQSLSRLCEAAVGIPALPGNEMHLLDNA